ncbi:MAG: SDR family oxidoreductase [Acidobacteria bacterium]|nr:SDR family oxidoreductase [Acidobacteriota bacterium]
MNRVLITGSSRGIGLELVRQYLNSGWRVDACCRKPDSHEELQQLAADNQQLNLHPLDVTNLDQTRELAHTLQGEAIDVFINNAGIMGDRRSDFGNLDRSSWQEVLSINTIAPAMLTELFLGHVEASQAKTFVYITSKVGSIADNQSGHMMMYRTSKTALNMVVKNIAIQTRARGIKAVCLHPGWVQTDMGGPNALISPQTSVQGMRKVIQDLTLEKSGNFYNYDGTPIPW